MLATTVAVSIGMVNYNDIEGSWLAPFPNAEEDISRAAGGSGWHLFLGARLAVVTTIFGFLQLSTTLQLIQQSIFISTDTSLYHVK